MADKMSSLFLRQSYLDNWTDYTKSLTSKHIFRWDYVILTASNEDQASAYRSQIQFRLDNHLLPESAHYAVLPDPEGKRVGSGGATLNVLRYIREREGKADCFKGKRILVIHSGGDSKRVPQYSACGKLFSPVPRELPNGNRSTLFDEFIIGMSGVPSRIEDGMLVLSGDVLLLFNPLQIDFPGSGAAAISIKAPSEVGQNHGVFLSDSSMQVERFLHKMSAPELARTGAVNAYGKVDLDTGAILMASDLVESLFSLISTDGDNDPLKFDDFVNEKARLSFYADFLYPLANGSTPEQFYKETPEGSFTDELHECRTAVWDAIHRYRLKLLALSPAEFIHFGTTRELLKLVTEDVDTYAVLDWSRNVLSTQEGDTSYALNNVLLDDTSSIGEGSYVEDSYLLNGTEVGAGTIVSNLTLEGTKVPSGVVLHGLKLAEEQFAVRIYGVTDNPKATYPDGAFLGTTLREFLDKNHLSPNDVWEDDDRSLWKANLFAPADSVAEAVENALLLYQMATEGSDGNAFRQAERMSFYSSFNSASTSEILPWQNKINNRVRAFRFIKAIKNGEPCAEAAMIFPNKTVNSKIVRILLERATEQDFSTKIRIYHYLAELCPHLAEDMEHKCFHEISSSIQKASDGAVYGDTFHIEKEDVLIELPVRVNWGGGWSDTPPYCNEHGGTVLNAAVRLGGELPIKVRIRKISEPVIRLESVDSHQVSDHTDIAKLQNCSNPFDPYALHKAALIASGVIPQTGDAVSVESLTRRFGGGFHLSTEVVNIPRGSGLGTSSILAAACVKAIYECFGQPLSDSEIYDRVLIMEQIMSTGGGWQDQVGGLTPGIKFISTEAGLCQKISCEQVKISPETLKELNDRFVLIYTGQRRLARNLLRQVVGKYISGNLFSVQVLHDIQVLAREMKESLEAGDIDAFAHLLNQHWELSKKLDSGCTNTCIDQIFLSVEDLLEGKMICGAGGGGFLQCVLKKGVTKEEAEQRLHQMFQDSGVAVWNSELYMG